MKILLTLFISLYAVFPNQKLDSLLEYLNNEDKFSGSVAILQNEEIIKSAYGRLDASEEKIDIKTKFRIGSVSKVFTAVIIMQLIEEGKIELGTPIKKFFPEFVNAGSISIKMLLNHHSGIFNITSDPNYINFMTKKQDRETLLNRIRIKGVNFNPAAKYEYSNSNYILLSFIIEDVTKKDFASVLKERITDKIGLANTYFGKKIQTDQNEAHSFKISSVGNSKLPETDPSVSLGAGGIVSTPEDLLYFMEALFDEKLISKENLSKMLPEKDSNGYGLGIMMIPYYNELAYGHNGGIDGFVSNLSYFPEKNYGFAICSNGLNWKLNDLMIATYKITNSMSYEFPSFNQFELTEAEKSRYVGTFFSKDLPLEITISATDNGLAAQASGQPSFDLKIESETKFTYSNADLEIVFVDSDKQKWNQFTLIQFGKKYQYKRK